MMKMENNILKTLIIPDLHNRVDWVEPFLSSQTYDRVVFLGDYFDDFYDTVEDAENSAYWLKKSLYFKDRIHLFGTHDIWYRFPIDDLMASGNSPYKFNVINDIIEESDWEKLKLFHFEQNFLISHAGLHSRLIGELSYRNFLSKLNPFEELKNGIISPLLQAGFSRGGKQIVGGMTWLDWNEEFEPVPQLNQIIGHTEHLIPQEKHTKFSKNYCIDTKNKYFGILENDIFRYEKTNI